MDERNIGGGAGAAGPANTPPFDRAETGSGTTGTEGGRPPSHREFPGGAEGTGGGAAEVREGGGGEDGSSETQQALESAKDRVMEETTPVLKEKAQEALSETTQRLQDTMSDEMRNVATAMQHDAQRAVTDRVQQIRSQAEERVNETMGRAAEGLDTAARRLDELGDRYAGESGVRATAGNMAHQVADAIESTAGYLRDNDVRKLQQDLERQVRENPLQTLLIGVAAGWVIGKILR